MEIAVIDPGYDSYEYEKRLFEKNGFEFNIFQGQIHDRESKIAFARNAVGILLRWTEVDETFLLRMPNLKAIVRYLLGRQKWSPFTLEPVEFVALNFDFHPKAVRGWLEKLGFHIEKTLTVSHFRLGLLKRHLPTGVLVALDSLAQWTGSLWQLTPSIFLKAGISGERSGSIPGEIVQWFKCPQCGISPLEDRHTYLQCSSCGSHWAVRDGIYDFREPLNS